MQVWYNTLNGKRRWYLRFLQHFKREKETGKIPFHSFESIFLNIIKGLKIIKFICLKSKKRKIPKPSLPIRTITQTHQIRLSPVPILTTAFENRDKNWGKPRNTILYFASYVIFTVFQNRHSRKIVNNIILKCPEN